MEISIDSPELVAWAARITKAGSGAGKILMRDYIIKATAVYKASIDARVPVKTGKLRSTLRGVTAGLTGVVSTSSGYGLYVEKGTQAHPIYPSAKQALYWRGAQHPVRAVFHPGTKATHFFENGVYQALPEIGVLNYELMIKLKDIVK
jgi:hypothetical protein